MGEPHQVQQTLDFALPELEDAEQVRAIGGMIMAMRA
jgi:hypothetical protein